MKRIITLVLALILALTLCACVTPKTPMPIEDGDKSAAQPVTVRLGGLKGPTSMGMVKLFDDADNGLGQNAYTYTIAASANELTPQLVQGELDVLAVPANVAAILYNQTEGGVVLLAAGTLGVLYIVEKGGETVTDIASLNGKTIYATGKGANPEYILNYLLTQNGVDPTTDVTIEWLTAEEVSAKMISSDSAVCMLPVPAATALMAKDSAVKQAISLSDAWDELGNGSLAMGCVVARTEFIEENPQAVADFLTEYEASINYMKDEANVDTASELVAQYKITPSAAIAAAAIPQCNLTFASGQEMKDLVEGYFSVLFQANPASIGGGMPYDSFYYGVA